jgi:predicted site-specific integrase-resolvase
MKLSDYAKEKGISYVTAFRHWKKGYITGEQLASGTIIVHDRPQTQETRLVSYAILYARVSSSENKSNLEGQLNRLRNYATAKGYTILKEVKEVGSGLNDKRPLLEKIFQNEDWHILVAEHKDRIARFGLNYIVLLLEKQGKKIEIVNNVLEDKADLIQDFVSIITSFTARLYGLRGSKRKTEQIIQDLQIESECN